MEPLGLFGLGLSTGLSGAMIPGPLFLYTVSAAFHEGQMAGVKIAVGHLLLEAMFVALIILGLRDLLVSPALRTTVVWVGSAGLVVMGALILRQVRRLSLARKADVAFAWGPVLGGMVFSLVSPGFFIWWATIGASVFLQGAWRGGEGIAMVGLGHAVADLSWCWFVAWSIERGRAFCSDRLYRVIMVALALSLILLGAGLALAG